MSDEKIERLRNVLEKVMQCCLFEDDDMTIGVAEDVVIENELFLEICEVLDETRT